MGPLFKIILTVSTRLAVVRVKTFDLLTKSSLFQSTFSSPSFFSIFSPISFILPIYLICFCKQLGPFLTVVGYVSRSVLSLEYYMPLHLNYFYHGVFY